MARKPTTPPAAQENKGERARLMNDPLDWINAPAESAVSVSTGKAPAPKPKAPPAVPTQNRTTAMTDAKVPPSQAWDDMHTFQVLDLLSNPMMVADADLVIRYVNEAAFMMFERIEGAIQNDLPHFRARDVIGKNIDVFHKNPAYQRRLMDGMSKPHDGKFSVGGAHLGFRATPKNSADGAVACIFVEWRDRTAEVQAQAELAQMVTAVRDMSTAHMSGEIDVKIDVSHFSGELGETMGMVNSMVQEHIDTKKKVVAAVTAMANGNLDVPMEKFNRKRAFLNDAVEAIRGSLKAFEGEIGRLLGDMKKMSAAHAAGDIEFYIDPNGYSPNYNSVVVGVNDMVKDHVATMRKIVACTGEFANGNFSAVLEQFPGKKAFINEGMEAVRANFKALVRDVGKMAQNLADGVLESSVNAAAHQGEFRNLINTIDTIRSNFGKVTTEIERLSRSIVDGALDVSTSASEYKGAYRQIIEAFELSFQSLNSVFGLIGQQVHQVAITVEQMSQASQSLATNSQIQSSSVDEVSASAEQTDVQVKSNAVSAATASQLVTGASEVAEGGKTKINEMVTAMEGIRASSQDIAKIIKVIDEIAFQTNLLALNAAVEAARAGQHGRGFAVVAQEVRNLAGRSAKAARETSDLIEDAATRVQAGVKIADETSRAFVSIADDIEKVKTLVRDIATASDEQARGVAQINLAVGEVAKSALATSQQAEELAASAAEMQAATQSMLAEVGRFRLRKPEAQTRLPDLQLAGLPAELMAQIQAMIAGQQTGASENHQYGSSNRDVRGYGGF